MNLLELKQKYQNGFIPYSELLNTSEWLSKRQAILQRDGNRCTNCQCGATMSHYDYSSQKRFHFWFGREKWVSTAVGTEELMPEILPALKPYHLQVHHEYYIINRLPWEYEDHILTTLCNWCHWEHHKNHPIKVYSEDLTHQFDYILCLRCNGAGWFPEYENIQDGVCFRCHGAKFEQPLIF